MRIRRYRPEDIDAVVELFRDTVRSVNRCDYSTDQVVAWAPDAIDAERWHARMASHLSVVAVQDDDIVGFAELTADGVVLMMFVHKDTQRQGVGTALLAALEHEARGNGVHEMKTESSITAVPFFEAHGFDVRVTQDLHLKGQPFRNYEMRKRLV